MSIVLQESMFPVKYFKNQFSIFSIALTFKALKYKVKYFININRKLEPQKYVKVITVILIFFCFEIVEILISIKF